MSISASLTSLRNAMTKRSCRLVKDAHRTLSSGSDKSDGPVNGNIPMIDYDDPDYLPIPQYPAKINEPLEQKRQRLLYQSRKRGMLENDLLLSTFAKKYLKDMNEENLVFYDQLINGPSNDWDIYYWASENKVTPPQYDTPIMKMLKEHAKNVKKELRIRQPSLY
ncbi:succinate dehydrogenase assembly factor 2-B, mitochondrial-like [Condylostylus longicornis]|uniref:succinate dehydrogenase assembly factor 2-B, mitochondrial-like n=1 Tax=Condylostylus longicornis TaxID=2530218 RepID=UPI00244DA0A5|nr:succinate dehydrogenase assembly factor 2-B, mitochondrial-like [Condylostylus longicornis]